MAEGVLSAIRQIPYERARHFEHADGRPSSFLSLAGPVGERLLERSQLLDQGPLRLAVFAFPFQVRCPETLQGALDGHYLAGQIRAAAPGGLSRSMLRPGPWRSGFLFCIHCLIILGP